MRTMIQQGLILSMLLINAVNIVAGGGHIQGSLVVATYLDVARLSLLGPQHQKQLSDDLSGSESNGTSSRTSRSNSSERSITVLPVVSTMEKQYKLPESFTDSECGTVAPSDCGTRVSDCGTKAPSDCGTRISDASSRHITIVLDGGLNTASSDCGTKYSDFLPAVTSRGSLNEFFDKDGNPIHYPNSTPLKGVASPLKARRLSGSWSSISSPKKK